MKRYNQVNIRTPINIRGNNSLVERVASLKSQKIKNNSHSDLSYVKDEKGDLYLVEIEYPYNKDVTINEDYIAMSIDYSHSESYDFCKHLNIKDKNRPGIKITKEEVEELRLKKSDYYLGRSDLKLLTVVFGSKVKNFLVTSYSNQ
jgi:hypothetical protein